MRLVDGAKLFTRAGETLAPGDLEPGLRVRAFGVLALSSTEPDRLDASLVFVHEHTELVRVGGTVIETFDPADGTLVIQAIGDTFVGPLCVALEPGRPRVPDRRSGRAAAIRAHRAHCAAGG